MLHLDLGAFDRCIFLSLRVSANQENDGAYRFQIWLIRFASIWLIFSFYQGSAQGHVRLGHHITADHAYNRSAVVPNPTLFVRFDLVG